MTKTKPKTNVCKVCGASVVVGQPVCGSCAATKPQQLQDLKQRLIDRKISAAAYYQYVKEFRLV